MLFRESFITDAGANIIARAAAGNGAIIWTRAATSNANTDGDSVSAMNALTDIIKTPTDSYTSSGVVTNAVVNDAQTSVAIYSEVTNEEYDGAACTFGAWAKIHGDEEDVLVIVARCGGATPTVINPASDGVVKAFVDFTLQISAEQAQAIEATEGYYATAAALQSETVAREALARRVVTTHSAADETTGDAQTIKGMKTFNDGIQGTTATFNTVNAIGNGGVNADYIFPITSNSSDSMIGNSRDFRFKNIYSNDINIETISAKDNANVTLSANLVPADGLTLGLGSQSYPFNDVNALQLNGVIPTPTKGTTPGTDNPTIPVGAIVMLQIEKTGAYFAQTAAVYCGETIYSGGGTLADGSMYNRLGVARFRQADSPNRIEIIAETQNFLTSGMSFKVIIGGTNESQKDTLRCMAMRIE